MRQRKIGFLVFLFLVSFASFAFASISLFFPFEQHQTEAFPKEMISFQMKTESINYSKIIPADHSISYQAWRRIQASA